MSDPVIDKPEIMKLLSPKLVPTEPAIAGPEPAGKEINTDSRGAARLGLWVLAIGLGGFLLWAAFAPLDEGVPSTGSVAIDTKRKPVQHPSGGIVKEVLVHEGERVKEGQLLIRLDEAVAHANYESMRQQYLQLRAQQGRLVAEQTGAATITFHPDLLAAKQDPLIQQQIFNQEQLFQSRRASLRADLQSMQESIEGQKSLIRSYQSMLGSRKSQLGLIEDELKSTRPLVAEGYVPRTRQLELERMIADTNASTAEILGNMERGQRAVMEMQQRYIVRQQDYRKEVETQLADVNRDVQSDDTKLHSLKDDLERIDIKSPAPGQVVGLAVQTVGGVIQSGQKLMDIVPDDEPLLIETRIPPHLIDRVHAGLPVDVRFSSFANSPQLVVDGTVVSVSGDLLTDQPTNQTYYLARVRLTPEGMKKLGKRVLQPGMPVDVVLKTGERSMLTYLLHPLMKRMAASLKEE
jgi:membrane fusion protein, protease secretion system